MGRGVETRELLRAVLERQPLFELLESNSASLAEVQAELDVSRSTAHRVVKQFESAGLISYQEGRYELTPLGYMVAEEIRGATKTVAVAQRLSPLLPTLSEEAEPFDFTAFADSEVATPEAGDPYRPIRRLILKINQVTALQELSPTIPEPAYLQSLFDRVQDELCASVVFSRWVVNRLQKSDKVALEEAISTGSLDVRIDDPAGFRLIIADDCVFLIGYNDDASHLRLVVDAHSPDAYDWANTYFWKRWDEATPYEEEYEDVIQ